MENIQLCIGIAGEVSVGKTTILNALIGQYIGETKRKRTTFVPFKFNHQLRTSEHAIDWIKENIIELNDEKAKEDMINYDVFFNWVEKDNDFSIIDFPGLNDPHEEVGKMETLLFKNLKQIQYLIYVVDSTKCLNSKYERDFIEKLFTQIFKNNCDYCYNEIIILFNKYDIEEDDEELDELVRESETFIKTLIKDNFGDKIKINIFRINGRKMMVKNILKKYGIQTIPKNILKSILLECHGSKETKMILQNGDIKEYQLNDIEFSKDENNFISLLKKIANTDFFHENYMKFIEKHVKSKEFKFIQTTDIDNYLLKIESFFDVVNSVLTNVEIVECYSKICECMFDQLVNEKDDLNLKTVVMFVFFTKKKIDISEIFLKFCTTLAMDISHVSYVINICVKFEIRNFANHIQKFFDSEINILIMREERAIIDIETQIRGIYRLNSITDIFSLKLNLFLIHQNLYRLRPQLYLSPIDLIHLYSEYSNFVIVEYINLLLRHHKPDFVLKFKRDFEMYVSRLNDFKKYRIVADCYIDSKNLNNFNNLNNLNNLNLIKKNIMYYPTSVITTFLIQKYFENEDEKKEHDISVKNVEDMTASEKKKYFLDKYNIEIELDMDEVCDESESYSDSE
jgi:GTPase SAR1 family protein